MNSTQARPIVVAALKAEGIEPTPVKVYVVQALARFDGGYGNYPSPPHGPEGPASNNWGAVQDRKNFSAYVKWSGITSPDRNDPEVKAFRNTPAPPSPKPNEFFYASDFQTGKGWFWGPYKVYPSAVDGARHVVRLLKTMGVLDVAEKERNWVAVARQMREKNYFVGYSNRTREQNIRDYAKNLMAGGTHFAELFGETDPLGWDSPKAPGAVVPPVVGGPSSSLAAPLPSLRFGSSGSAVELWQRFLNRIESPIKLEVDGQFGRLTEKVTRHYQAWHHLNPDGVVGPKTWSQVS